MPAITNKPKKIRRQCEFRAAPAGLSNFLTCHFVCVKPLHLQTSLQVACMQLRADAGTITSAACMQDRCQHPLSAFTCSKQQYGIYIFYIVLQIHLERYCGIICLSLFFTPTFLSPHLQQNGITISRAGFGGVGFGGAGSGTGWIHFQILKLQSQFWQSQKDQQLHIKCMKLSPNSWYFPCVPPPPHPIPSTSQRRNRFFFIFGNA